MEINAFLDTVLFRFHDADVTLRKVLLIGFIFIGASLFKHFLSYLLSKKLQKSRASFDSGTYSIIQLLSYFVYFFAVLAVLGVLNINITVLLAGSTALLVGIGLGMQEIFKNLVSGFTILLDGTVHRGDIIDFGGQTAKAKNIGLRTSIFETREGVSIIVPNSKLVAESVQNVSFNRKPTLFYIEIGVDYSSDPRQVEDLLTLCAQRHEKVLETPTPFVRFSDYGESSLVFQLFFSTMQFFEVENIKSDLRYSVFAELKKHGVKIPFPQREMHIVSGE